MLPAAEYRRLDFVRVIRQQPAAVVEGPGDLIGLVAARPEAPVGRRPMTARLGLMLRVASPAVAVAGPAAPAGGAGR